MAKQKRFGRKSEPAKWVRTAGATGDPSFDELEAWTRNGCGVDETEHEVGNMPNESVMRPISKKVR